MRQLFSLTGEKGLKMRIKSISYTFVKQWQSDIGRIPPKWGEWDNWFLNTYKCLPYPPCCGLTLLKKPLCGLLQGSSRQPQLYLAMRNWNNLCGKGRHCCSVGELKITFASTCNHGCKESVFNVLFNVLFLVLDFPLGAPNTLLKRVIERSIWRIVVGEGSWWGWGFSQDWWLGFWSCWSLSLTAVFWIDFSVACFKRV